MAGSSHGVRALIERSFGIDPRSLAAVRIGFGAILLIDLAFRAGQLRAAYTDEGAVPRAELDPWIRETIAPLHLLSGAFGWEALLFGVAAVFAVLLTIGFYTRTATVVSWLLLLSLQARNPLLLNFGDQILRVSLFWALFLPLGRCWSVDAARAKHPPSREPECSIASAGLLLQVFLIYFFTAILKAGPDWHEDGTALYYAMQLDWLVLPLGVWLRDIFWITQLLTWSTLVLEYVGPFLLIAPFWPVRLLAVLAFAGLHVGISATMRLGVFPWIDVTVLLAFLPREVWDAAEAFVRRVLGLPAWVAASVNESARNSLPRFVSVALAAVFAYVLVHNIASVKTELALPELSERAMRIVGLQQKWLMFTPNVPRSDGWFVLPARLADGRIIDVSPRGPALRWERSSLASADYPSSRWAQYMQQIANPVANGPLRRAHVRWICREQNRHRPASERIERVDVFLMREMAPPPGGVARIESLHLASHACPQAGEKAPAGWDVAVPKSGAEPPPLVTPPIGASVAPERS